MLVIIHLKEEEEEEVEVITTSNFTIGSYILYCLKYQIKNTEVVVKKVFTLRFDPILNLQGNKNFIKFKIGNTTTLYS